MSDSECQDLLAWMEKANRVFARGIITPAEYVNRVINTLGDYEDVYPNAIPDIWEATPLAVREELARKVRMANRQDYIHRPFLFGPGPTEEQTREATVRVRAWIIEFAKRLDDLESKPS